MKKAMVAAAVCLFTVMSAVAADSFTPQQKDEIGKIASDYLIEHPEVLIKVSQKLQQKQMQAMQQRLLQSVLANKDILLNDKNTPMIKPAGANVAVIEFFDYQCAFCHKVFSEYEQIMKNNPNVMYVFKEFPIFSERWAASKYGAEMGYAVYQLGGYNAYLKYHHAIFSSGKEEGKLTVDDINHFAKQSGVDINKAKAQAGKDAGLVTDTLKFGMSLGFEFTPVFVIMPLDGANDQNTTVIPGYADQKTLQDAINKAAGK
ncbi:MAG: hypothetical protein A3F10_01990 [Coxiella sp. RIFCSPHIGHO2_12_FULL_42_15]|nr:MAG: hypothetical protein A3F10_01990 [Coxiella sp. RIFCSPHIGHO2_12_FULL_42_15]